MAHYRGTVQGGRTEASRLGTKSSGLHVEACSWQGKVAVTLTHDATTGQDIAEVWLRPHYGAGVSALLYRGPVGEAPVALQYTA